MLPVIYSYTEKHILHVSFQLNVYSNNELEWNVVAL